MPLHTIYMRCMNADIDTLFTRVRVRANNRMSYRWAGVYLFLCSRLVHRIAPALFPAMYHVEALDYFFHFRQQFVIGHLHICKLRCAAIGRHLDRIENRSEGWNVMIRLVAMPKIIAVTSRRCSGLTIGIQVGHDMDHRKGFAIMVVGHVPFNLTETLSECSLLLIS